MRGKIAAFIGANFGWSFKMVLFFSPRVYASFIKTKNALSTPSEGSATTIGNIFLPELSSVIFIDFFDFSWWAVKS